MDVTGLAVWKDWAAHLETKPSLCGCSPIGPGWIKASIKDDGERLSGDVCGPGSKLWEELRQAVAIRLSKYGEMLTMYPQMTPERWEDSRISTCVGVHLHCNSFVDVKRISDLHNALHCRGCGLRVVVPLSLETINQLRRWADDGGWAR